MPIVKRIASEEYADEKALYEGVLYKVLQDHNSLPTWTPVAAASLFAKILIPDVNVTPEQEQPDSTNPYVSGDKVTYNGSTWMSMIDHNVWGLLEYMVGNKFKKLSNNRRINICLKIKF